MISRSRAEGDHRKAYRDCPQRCPKNKKREYDVFRSELCQTCPRRTDRERLKRATRASWVVWLGDTIADSLDFEHYMNSLQQILAAKRYDTTEIPVKVSLLVDVYETEKSWFDDDNRPRIT